MHRFGPYTLLQRIGAGGMAEIFLARREGPGGVEKVVALKRILPHLADFPDFVAMFLDEAQLAARLSHPHIAQIYDFGEVDGHYYLAMEYVPGEDLLTIIRRAREIGLPTPAAAGAAILAAAAEALHHAHEQRDERGRPLGIVHRDVTPSNLIVSHDGVVKLVDFGIAKAERRLAVTAAGALKGKYAYMSPEHALAMTVDRRSDVFSLGIVGYELLTQKRLFHRDSELAVLKAITEDPIPTASSRRPDLPTELDAILRTALARDANERYQDAQTMADDLIDFAHRHGGGSPGEAVSELMHTLFGADDAALRRRWALGDVGENDLESTEGLGRAPSAAPEESTLGGALARGTPSGAGLSPAGTSAGKSPFARGGGDDDDDGDSAPHHVDDAPTARAQSVPRGGPPPAAPRTDTEHVGLRRRGGRRVLGMLIGVAIVAAAAGGAYAWLNGGGGDGAGGRDRGGSAKPRRYDPGLPSVRPAAPPALDAPTVQVNPEKKLATAVARPGAPAEGPTAWLAVDAPAGARVLMDNEPLGVAPIARRKVPAGLHTITVVGSKPDFNESFALELPEGADHTEVVRVGEDGKVTRGGGQ